MILLFILIQLIGFLLYRFGVDFRSVQPERVKVNK